MNIEAGFQAVGITPREADLAVVEMLGGTVEVLAEYIWDHYLGEPDEPTLEDIETQIKGAAS